MAIPVTVPRLGWNMEEGTFVEWLKADGDAVRPGDAVFRLEGEKAAEDVEALDAGVLRIPDGGPKPGDRVAVGAVIGFLVQDGEAAPQLAAATPKQTATVAVPEAPVVTTVRADDGGSQAVTPRARRLAARNGIDAANLRGTGRNGRVRERDVTAALGPTTTDAIPVTPIRRAIAVRMSDSARTTAPVTLTALVDATNLVALRARLKADGDPAPSYTDLLVKLVAHALGKHPLLTARWADDFLRPADRIHVGIAVDTDAGLLVPVVRDVPALSLRQLAERSRDLIERARAGRLSARELEGGCFTVTNLGAYGIDAFTPIINLPESAILGVGRISRRPAVVGDAIVPREQVTLSLTFDHRVVDGGPAARFLQTLTGMIEEPGPWVE